MTNVQAALTAHRAAVDELFAAAERTGPNWNKPRMPGKWSPSQVVEHVARALEESANVIAGRPSKFPSLPAILRPVLRSFLFNRVLKKNDFPTARTSRAFDPEQGQETPAAARIRLHEALARFEQACRARAASQQTIESKIFGTVSVEDYVRFQEIHAHHHRKQIPGGG